PITVRLLFVIAHYRSLPRQRGAQSPLAAQQPRRRSSRLRGLANRRPEKIVCDVCLPREITFDGASIDKWRGKSEPQLFSAFSQGALGREGIARGAREIGKLTGLPHDGSDHRKNIHG